MPVLEPLIIAYPEIDPVAISIGPFPIRWYALSYIVGLLIGWQLMVRRARLPGAVTISRTQIDDFLIWAVIGVMMGGRIGYVVFYNLPHFLSNPLEIPQVWLGGMSFHGGLAGLTISALLFARRNTIHFLALCDLIAAVAPVGILLGRISNFVNGELWGRVTEVPWAMIFPGGGPNPRHPSQLYEAFLEGFLLLIITQCLYQIKAIRCRPGIVAGIFLFGYGSFRFVVEFFREPDIHLGFIVWSYTLGQCLTLPLVIIGIYLIVRAQRLSSG